MIDAVLSYHVNPYACGVAKWSIRLARELGVPFGQYCSAYRHPLVCVKHAEFPLYALDTPWESYDLFLHDFVGGPLVERWFREHKPERVYAANAVIARAVCAFRPDVIEAWCPSTIDVPPQRAALTVLTFGMAHKQIGVLAHYQKLKALLDAHGEPYTILVSTGVHEGSPWDEALEQSAEAMRGIFGAERVEVLGFLSDAALHREILNATACAAFYAPAFRANNTSGWAVVDRSKPLVTNIDADSPQPDGVFNVESMEWWPRKWYIQDKWNDHQRSWRNLLTVLKVEQPCVS